jgi:hypothetical protein
MRTNKGTAARMVTTSSGTLLFRRTNAYVASTVAAGSQLPDSLRKLVEAWQMEGASRDEIVDRLDQLDLLAHEERIRLMIELLSPT